MIFANFVINLLLGCVFLMLLGWTVDLLAALRHPASSTPTPTDARPASPRRRERRPSPQGRRSRGAFPISP